MTPTDEELLRHGLGEVGAWGGGLGGGRPGAEGGRIGARWAARFLKREERREALTLPTLDPAAAREAVAAALSALDAGLVDDEPERVRALIGAGVKNLNPAVVELTLRAHADGGTAIDVRAVANEGLIKQRTAERAIGRVRDALAATSG